MWGAGLIVAIALGAALAVAADPVKKAYRREKLTQCDKRLVVAALAVAVAGVAVAFAGRRRNSMTGGCYNSHTTYIRPVSYQWPDPPAPQIFIGGADASVSADAPVSASFSAPVPADVPFPAPAEYVPFVPPPGLDVPSGGGTLPAPIELPPFVPPPAAAAIGGAEVTVPDLFDAPVAQESARVMIAGNTMVLNFE